MYDLFAVEEGPPVQLWMLAIASKSRITNQKNILSTPIQCNIRRKGP